MNTRVLLVDDDPNVLAAYTRQLRNRYEIESAQGAEDALQLIRKNAVYAVVVSDMKMPGMDGIELLSRIRETSPETVRIMLTGYADLETAMEAVNQGNIFRFLTKPCAPAVMNRVIRDAVEQYRLVTAEKELLEQTLSGAVKVLTEILAIVNPDAFSRTNRLISIVNFIASNLQLENLWEFQLAGMLSQIGWVTLPPDILDKIYLNEKLDAEDEAMYQEHPKTAERLLSKIPRMENITKMIALQLDPALA
jgi:response regulator RpfG family c-di-GMP phosphodiesterase